MHVYSQSTYNFEVLIVSEGQKCFPLSSSAQFCRQMREDIEITILQRSWKPIETMSWWMNNSFLVCRYFGEKERVASTPCSYSQELLLFNNELDPFNPVHNEAAWVKVHGELDIAAMSRAFRYLTDRHTVLQSHLYIAVGHLTICIQNHEH